MRFSQEMEQLNMKFLLLSILLIFSLMANCYGQNTALEEDNKAEQFLFGNPDSTFSLVRKAPLTIDMEEEEDENEELIKEKKKKRKKNVFYGMKTKKGFTRRGVGNRITLELFHYLKDPVKTDPYVPVVYWYDKKDREVKVTRSFNPKKGYLLHGPYKKVYNEQVIEKGIFYKGLKHGRWTKYTNDDILTDKRKYDKGWPKEAILSYYDDDQKKLKEVLPIVYEEKNGDYYYFHENGEIAIRGEYEEGKKVGEWTEYYPFYNRKKKEIQYPNDPYDPKFEPFIKREWNKRGKLVYEKEMPDIEN